MSPIARGRGSSKAGGLIGNGTDSSTPGFVMQTVDKTNTAMIIILSHNLAMQYLCQDINSNHQTTSILKYR